MPHARSPSTNTNMVLLQHVPSWLPRELLDKLQLTYLGEDWTGDWGSFAVGRGADSRTAIGTLRLDAVTSFPCSFRT